MKYLLINFFLISAVFAEEVFYFDERTFDNGIFTGLYDERRDQHIWGKIEYDSGDTFEGVFDNNIDYMGSYNFKDGTSGLFIRESGIKNSLRYSAFGQYTNAEGNECHGYFSKPFTFNGYMFCEKPDDSTVELFYKDNTPEGYYKYFDISGDKLYGYYQKDGLQGDAYYYFAAEGYWRKYYYSYSGDISDAKMMNKNDYDRLNMIESLMKENFDDLEIKWNSLLARWNSYNETVALYTDSSTNKSKSARSKLIQSTQELLIELGFAPGSPDGLMGAKTSSAIKAFQLMNDLDVDGKVSEELLILLQVALQASKKNNASEKYSNSIELIGTGSGFYINENNIVTNFHVIEGCKQLNNNDEEILKVLVVDEKNDLAILKGPSTENYLNISPTSPELGEEVYVSGFPLFDTLKGINFTSGNVSALRGLGQDTTQFQFTAPVQPGNSGGPIVNSFGSIIGVVVSMLDSKETLEQGGFVAQNANFGIKNSLLKNLLEDNNLTYKSYESFWLKTQRELASISSESSVLIKCYGN